MTQKKFGAFQDDIELTPAEEFFRDHTMYFVPSSEYPRSLQLITYDSDGGYFWDMDNSQGFFFNRSTIKFELLDDSSLQDLKERVTPPADLTPPTKPDEWDGYLEGNGISSNQEG